MNNSSNDSGRSVNTARASYKPSYSRRRESPADLCDAKEITYKNIGLLKHFCSDEGKMTPARITGTSMKKQRLIKKSIRQARTLGLMYYVKKF